LILNSRHNEIVIEIGMERPRLFQCIPFHRVEKSAKPKPQWNNECRFQSRIQSRCRTAVRRRVAAAAQVVTDPRKIAVNYVKSWFVIDAVAAVPFDLLLFGTGTSDVSVHHRHHHHLYSHT